MRSKPKSQTTKSKREPWHIQPAARGPMHREPTQSGPWSLAPRAGHPQAPSSAPPAPGSASLADTPSDVPAALSGHWPRGCGLCSLLCGQRVHHVRDAGPSSVQRPIPTPHMSQLGHLEEDSVEQELRGQGLPRLLSPQRKRSGLLSPASLSEAPAPGSTCRTPVGSSVKRSPPRGLFLLQHQSSLRPYQQN